MVLRLPRMWFSKPSHASEERLEIRASLKRGETLHITFSDRAKEDIDIEGPGDIRLAIRPRREFKAEVVRPGDWRHDSSSAG